MSNLNIGPDSKVIDGKAFAESLRERVANKVKMIKADHGLFLD